VRYGACVAAGSNTTTTDIIFVSTMNDDLNNIMLTHCYFILEFQKSCLLDVRSFET
jgi:hypothetical protein